jgi:hypothetical protein
LASDPLYRNRALAQALIDASTQATYPMNVHQFFRLTGGWWDHGFKIMVGIRAGRIFKTVMGEPAPRSRSKVGHRNEQQLIPRAIWEEAFIETKAYIIANGGNLDDYRKEPYAKVPPTETEVAQRRYSRSTSSEPEVQRWTKMPLPNPNDGDDQ